VIHTRLIRCLIVATLSLTLAPRVGAQAAAMPLAPFQVELPAYPTTPIGGGRELADSVLPCPDCNPPKRFWVGAGELMIVQLIPWLYNSKIRDAEWAQVSPSTWATNFENPWKWDNNKFKNNQFSHPYHGALYFNSGRANGYDFWESAPWAFGGSLMWELMGEAWAPSPNDLLNTTLGGISLGEMLWRVSSLTLDNTATGAERTFREIGATLLNPVRGFNRITRGEVNDISANPPDWRPTKIFASMDLGYKGVVGESDNGQRSEINAAYAGLLLSYGDQVEDIDGAPFSAFTVRAELSTDQGDAGHLAILTARGNLAARTLSQHGSTQHRLGAFMFYEYQESPALEFGGQGFAGGLVSRWGDPKARRIQTRLLATAWPVVAVQSDHYVSLEGRDYDYGVGLGAEAAIHAIDEGKWAVGATGRYLWEPILSGFNGDHYQATGTLEGRYYFWGRIGVGASGTLYWRKSVYEDYADVRVDATQVRAYATVAVPRWAP
jgi:hypothetical protein